jgi:hypothetical protein
VGFETRRILHCGPVFFCQCYMAACDCITDPQKSLLRNRAPHRVCACCMQLYSASLCGAYSPQCTKCCARTLRLGGTSQQMRACSTSTSFSLARDRSHIATPLAQSGRWLAAYMRSSSKPCLQLLLTFSKAPRPERPPASSIRCADHNHMFSQSARHARSTQPSFS